MQPSTPIRPVSGTLFEAIQLLRPHPKIRSVSAPSEAMHLNFDSGAPDGDRWSKFSGATAVDRPETPHLYTSRRQYEVATSQTLGALSRRGDDLEVCGPESPSSALSSRSIYRHAKALLSPHSGDSSETLDGEKVHGTFCRARSVVEKSLRRSKQGGNYVMGSQHSLRPGYCSASTDQLVPRKTNETKESNASTVSNDPPQIPPLRPVSKFMSTLTISIPENELSSSVTVEHHFVESGSEEVEEGEDETENSSAAHLWGHSSVSAANSENERAAGETPFSKARDDDDVFAISNETSQLDPPVNSFMTRLLDTMGPRSEYKAPMAAAIKRSSSRGSTSALKLRHTAPHKVPRPQPTSLRAQFALSELPSSPPTLDVPKVWKMDETEMNKTVRLAPSLEHGLKANDLKVFEEDAVAAAAPVVRGVKPDVVDIRGSRVIETSAVQDSAVSDRRPPLSYLDDQPFLTDTSSSSPCTTLSTASCVARPATSPLASLSVASKHDPGTPPKSWSSATARQMPVQILETIVFSAAYGDAECRVLASSLYDELIENSIADLKPRFDARGQRLLLQSHLVQELDSLVQLGFLPQEIFSTIRGQLFPTRATIVMGNQQFKAYIYRAVHASHMHESWAKEVLELVIGDEGFAQCSPEEEVFFARQPFNTQGFVYDDNADYGPYERVDSMRSTAGTFESEEPQLQPGWRSSFWSKVVHILRLFHGKRRL